MVGCGVVSGPIKTGFGLECRRLINVQDYGYRVPRLRQNRRRGIAVVVPTGLASDFGNTFIELSRRATALTSMT
jgi:hypothetical protein